MEIVIIGTGNVASVLGQRLKTAGHPIKQVYGRNENSALSLADELGAVGCSDWNAIDKEADCYLIAFSDQALVDRQLPLHLGDRLVVHTAGSVPMDSLGNITTNYGVFYPLQSIRKKMDSSIPIPFLIDAVRVEAKHTLTRLAHSMGSSVAEADDEKRLRYHVSAVVANNFTNYLFTLVQDYCKKNGLDFSNLLPLLDETISRLHRHPAVETQTGPARRGDLATIESHLELLKKEPELSELYKNFSRQILDYPWTAS